MASIILRSDTSVQNFIQIAKTHFQVEKNQRVSGERMAIFLAQSLSFGQKTEEHDDSKFPKDGMILKWNSINPDNFQIFKGEDENLFIPEEEEEQETEKETNAI